MKYALVTGASRGIGKEVTLQLAQKGYFVFLAGRNINLLEETKKVINEANQEAEIVPLDLLSLNDIKEVPNRIKQITDRIDVLANIAGIYHDDEKHFFNIPFENYPDDAIIKNINASLVGHILLTKYLTPFFNSNSCVINMSGTFDEGETGVISDFITKNAIEIFSKQLVLELKNKKVRSNCIRPAFVLTDSVKQFFPDVTENDALEPAVVASKIIEVAENQSLNGQVIEIRKS